MHSVSVNLDAAQYLAGFRQEAATLFVPTLSESRVGDEVAVRVGIYGQTIRATLFGKVSLVRRVGRPALPPGAEIVLDKNSRAAASFLAMAARGEPVTFQERSPRFAAERPLAIEHGGAWREVRAINFSEGGCSVRWPGQLPLVGDLLSIRVGDGFFAKTALAVVCWNHPGGPVERSVGLKIVSEGRPARAWRTLVQKIARSGVRTA